MDKFNLKLLELVQKNNRLTAEQLSEKVGLSPTACQKRLKKMREDGVIREDIAVVNRSKVGQSVTLIVEVTLESERPEYLDQFKKTMRNTPEVMQCFYVTGNADFIVILSAKNMKAYEDFTRRYFFENRNVKRFHTNVVMDEVKLGLSIPVELLEE
ncbi:MULTISPECIES: Lrp/AsnC family transcriptional regulator [Curvivirga]|uniref:Lrp/AsnC family transcriptional regulator n=1 Tax=Curvivirga TaxID=2856846 RepID=UPI0012BCD2A8|nr:Lrp/AsnC family transcriptional regulator [Curvivirga aplysinae]MTI08676.1 Lrp/AsnC family transcriptional regulator [Curvivirga aplysinae]